ncbi:carbon-nitrogen hydrolase family protein [Dyadobacter chenhuakuii]|uniref:Carbon-nitrogen hydrolase family protein n=1 Tax=Dyadobacter chenhuakuii TaxID=2909339 RepID=A0ABY4XLG9_9BACT|nr:carbon-nitrogen hydrolase family protein [Dyadobacter chenhuakuii]MCF2494157.1 carbon-nitrogen hydrolase family protein [Dyadobacter chenhuakuii]USJ31285.1 carbon-nitrogen hydrolase family protein [Dyadobacter chenhuakuii]
MKLCVAQTKPVKGDISGNIVEHLGLIKQAIEEQADVIIFPELSLTGYEPELAVELVMHLDDSRLQPFQDLSDANGIIIGVGLPTRGSNGILISLLVFIPNQPRQVYSKQYLHADEEPYFIPGRKPVLIRWKERTISFAICYEVFVPEHACSVIQNGADIYIASVAKSAKGVVRAYKRLAQIAGDFGITVLMANSVGYQDNFQSAGFSASWSKDGELAGQLGDEADKLLLFNL